MRYDLAFRWGPRPGMHGPGQSAWEDVPYSGIKDVADAVVPVDAV